MPKKKKIVISVFVENPHVQSHAALLLLRREYEKLDDNHWTKRLKLRDRLVKELVKKNIPLRCEYCGRPNLIPFPKNNCQNALTLDHVMPHCRSRNNNPSNLVMSCRSCNSKKSDKILPIEVIKRLKTLDILLKTA